MYSLKFLISTLCGVQVSSHGRKLVTIVDPHIKKDSGYWVHNDLSSKGLYVKNKDGGDYEGWCWPGASYYPDFLNSEARDYFAEQYRLENYKGVFSYYSQKLKICSIYFSRFRLNSGHLYLE